jgi:hypothetical protein
MKNKISTLAAVATLLFASCKDKINTWGDGDPALEHVYYVGFYKTTIYSAKLDYSPAQGDTASIPVQLHSERVRSYDVTTCVWITDTAKVSGLSQGADYIVLGDNGAAISPSASGAYSLTWPQAVKGTQALKIVRKSAATGQLKVNTLDPAKGTPTGADIATTVNNTTADYEVRGLTHDWNTVTVNFK